MNDVVRGIAAGLLCSAGLMLAACGSSSTSSTGSTPIPVAMTVTGLNSGASIELSNNGGTAFTLTTNGSSPLGDGLQSGTSYDITIAKQPQGENCTVSNGTGTVGSTAVTNILIACTPLDYSIGGTLTGLLPSNSLMVEDNGGNSTTLSANGSFSFSGQIASGSAYAVTVASQPPGQSCAVTNGSGTVVSSNVTTVAIVCSDNVYTIGVTVSGLTASGLVLQDNGGDNLAVSANGSVNFATPIPSGSSYAITVLTQPSGQSCTVTGGSGTVSSSAVSGIAVSCVAIYTIGGSVSGLTSGSLILQDNGGDNLSVSANGSFTFATPTTNGGAYAVTILTQPPGQTCAIANASGSVSAANVTNVTVSCGNLWIWVGGSNSAGASGVYGTLGTAATSNVPGARYSPVTWTDPSGNLWLFGGLSTSGGYLNDLWEFNPTAGTWEWVSGSSSAGASGAYGSEGVASTGNVPGARYAAISWTDAAGNLWLFGGLGLDAMGSAGFLNDLWEFSPTAGTWEWVGGSNTTGAYGLSGTQGVASTGNVPGARYAAISWTDGAGNLWLFGGYGLDSVFGYGNLNDLWEFSPTAGTWEWVSGSNGAGASGVYGTQRVAASGNVPGARQNAISWTDATGNLWLFGGNGNDAFGSFGYLNDLWEFSPTAGTWEWFSGSNSAGAGGVYGNEGVAASGNVPGARYAAISWIDASGNLWLSGGYGYDASGTPGYLNDLWEFNPASGIGTWTWVSGSNTGDAFGVYGTQGVAATTNVPGARFQAGAWIDRSGNLWLLGGSGRAASTDGYLNDLWEFVP